MLDLKSLFRFPPHEPSDNQSARQTRGVLRQNGQIVVEYILLLVIAVTLAVVITRNMIGREQGSEGFVIRAWQELITAIGKDYADDVSPKK